MNESVNEVDCLFFRPAKDYPVSRSPIKFGAAYSIANVFFIL